MAYVRVLTFRRVGRAITPPADTRRRVTDQFLAGCLGGDLNQVMELPAPDVTAWTDGGGKIRAALRPLQGADNVARWILGVLAGEPSDVGIRHVLVTASPQPGQATSHHGTLTR